MRRYDTPANDPIPAAGPPPTARHADQPFGADVVVPGKTIAGTAPSRGSSETDFADKRPATIARIARQRSALLSMRELHDPRPGVPPADESASGTRCRIVTENTEGRTVDADAAAEARTDKHEESSLLYGACLP
jgi:hypothetical protein